MTRKNWYFLVLVFALAIVAVGFIMNVATVKYGFNRVLTFSLAPVVFIPAAIFAFIFIDNKHFWLITLALAIVTSLVIQYGIIKKDASLFIFSMRCLAFMAIAYVLSFVKLLFGKS